MIAEVSGKLIGQFVDCIENRLLGDGVIDDVAAQSAATSVAGTPDAATAEAQNSAPEPVEALDLMELAGNSVYKRLAPVGAVIVLLILARFLFRRRS